MTDLKKIFQAAVLRNQELLNRHQLIARVGVWLGATALKLHKKHWTNRGAADHSTGGEIFFSIWADDDGLTSGKASYNIHALKLRELTPYVLQSREFAEAFRAEFALSADSWPNVSTDFGPQTLMEGWIPLEGQNFDRALDALIKRFVAIHGILDRLLEERARTKSARAQ